MFSSFRVPVHLPNAALSASLLWGLAILLMLVATFWEIRMLGWWSILTSVAATTCSVSAIASHARSVILDVVSWEHRRTRGETPTPNEPDELPTLPRPRSLRTQL